MGTPRPEVAVVGTAARGVWFGRCPYREAPATPEIEAAGGRYCDALERWHATRKAYLAHIRAQSDLLTAMGDLEIEIERHDRESMARPDWFRGVFRVQGVGFRLKQTDVGMRTDLSIDIPEARDAARAEEDPGARRGPGAGPDAAVGGAVPLASADGGGRPGRAAG